MTATNESHPFAMLALSPAFSPALSTTFSLAGLCAGFDDPVHQSQRVFRCALTALSEPGTCTTCRRAQRLKARTLRHISFA